VSSGSADTTFTERLRLFQRQMQSSLCVGLDVDPRRLPDGLERNAKGVRQFITGIVEATRDLVCAYKPNLAFFEALGEDGFPLLRHSVEVIGGSAITIADGKRGDLGNTAERYATALFEVLGFDAATLHPYQGLDSLEPYLQDPSKGAFLLCRTSNPGAADLQDLRCELDGEQMPLYEAVARRALEWNTHGNIGLVVGATFPEQLQRVRSIAPELPFLIPGVGAQGGDAADAVRLGAARDGTMAVVNASRQVLYASAGPDWQAAARREALALRDQMSAATAGR
jgi:orotidine-5'-phosphate decarboxylase